MSWDTLYEQSICGQVNLKIFTTISLSQSSQAHWNINKFSENLFKEKAQSAMRSPPVSFFFFYEEEEDFFQKEKKGVKERKKEEEKEGERMGTQVYSKNGY